MDHPRVDALRLFRDGCGIRDVFPIRDGFANLGRFVRDVSEQGGFANIRDVLSGTLSNGDALMSF